MRRFEFVRGDICDAGTVEAAITKNGIDTIVKFAAETHVDRSIMDPDAFIQTDVYGTYVLLEAARKAGNLRYHQISTDEVYGHIHGDHRSVKSDGLASRSPYAASKAAGDHMAHAYYITYGSGDHHAWRQQHRPLPVSREGRAALCHERARRPAAAGLRRRQADARLPVRDGSLSGIAMVLQHGAIGEVYNIGTGKEMSNIQMVEILLDESSCRKADTARRGPPGPRPALLHEVDKLVALGWEPEYTHEEAIRKTVRWYVDNRWWWEPIRSGEFKEYYSGCTASAKS